MTLQLWTKEHGQVNRAFTEFRITLSVVTQYVIVALFMALRSLWIVIVERNLSLILVFRWPCPKQHPFVGPCVFFSLFMNETQFAFVKHDFDLVRSFGSLKLATILSHLFTLFAFIFWFKPLLSFFFFILTIKWTIRVLSNCTISAFEMIRHSFQTSIAFHHLYTYGLLFFLANHDKQQKKKKRKK